MPYQPAVFDYESVGPSSSAPQSRALRADWSSPEDERKPEAPLSITSTKERAPLSSDSLVEKEGWWSERYGHVFSYWGLFIFTAILFFRPYEYIPALASFSSLAFWPAIITLAIFFPTQVSLEGTLTARPREVNLLLLLCAAALLSMPLAINPAEAWGAFNETFVKAALMFIVIINAVRSERRLMWMLILALAVSFALSLNALDDYRLGNFDIEGYRVKGSIGGMFGNPNDMALHLVTMLPIAVGLFLNTRNVVKKLVLATCLALYLIAIVVTFSRGGFLGLICVTAFLSWKMSRRNRPAVILMLILGACAFLALAPGEYSNRLASISDFSLDPNGSANARQALLTRSILVTIKNPIFGVGMGNFHTVSIHEQVSHNAYTQVSAEMGLAAMIIYVMFIVTPLKRLRQIERDTVGAKAGSSDARFQYLAIALQASLIGFMVSSFFASVAYNWYIYYLVGYAVALRRLYIIRQRKSIENGAVAASSSSSSSGGQFIDESLPSGSGILAEAQRVGVRS